MSGRVVLTVATLAVQLLLALSPFIPGVASWWHEQSAADSTHIGPILTLLGLSIAVMTVSLQLFLLMTHLEQSSFNEHALARLNQGTHSRMLRDDEFYADFFKAIKLATSHVSVSYFAPTPPTASTDPVRIEYYASVHREMKRNARVRFKRLIRLTDANVPWIIQTMHELKGAANADVAILNDLPADQEMPLALSVQVVDSVMVWFVAIGSHQRDDNYRDVFIQSEDVAKMMAKYYLRLWSHAVEVVKEGQFTPKGHALIAQHQSSNVGA